MSLAALSAGVAAALAAVATAELLATREARARGPRRRRAVAALETFGRQLGAPSPPRDLPARLAAAGEPLGLAPADVMALKAAAAALALPVALALASLAPGRLGAVVLAAAPAAGFLAPDALLRRRARRRAETIELELPDVAELLRVATGAGLAPVRALEEVGRRHPGLLAAELGAVGALVAVGVPQREALERLRRRAPVAGVGALAAALDRAATHGAPLGDALAAIAADARAVRVQRLHDRAARAAPKIQLVVALLLVPAVLLLVAAALAGSLLGP